MGFDHLECPEDFDCGLLPTYGCCSCSIEGEYVSTVSVFGDVGDVVEYVVDVVVDAVAACLQGEQVKDGGICWLSTASFLVAAAP